MRYELYGIVDNGSGYSNYFGHFPSFKQAVNNTHNINHNSFPNFAILEKAKKSSAPISISSGKTITGLCTRTKSFITGENPIQNVDDAYWYWKK